MHEVGHLARELAAQCCHRGPGHEHCRTGQMHHSHLQDARTVTASVWAVKTHERAGMVQMLRAFAIVLTLLLLILVVAA